MMKFKLIVLAATLLANGWGGVSAAPVAFKSNRAEVQRKVDSLLSRMTLRQKIGQLNQLSGDWEQTGPSAASVDKQAAILNGEVGSVLNMYGASTTRQIQQIAMNSELKIPLIFAQDVVHGYRTTFPIPLAEAASFDLELIERAARIAAIEASSAGIHWTFAPMVDISRDPRWGRVMEGAGEDTYLNVKIAQARVRGFQGDGIGSVDAVMACAKHFVGYGAGQAGRDYNTTDISERTLREVYFPPFKAAVEAGVGSFMTSFNDLNGVPATGNEWLFRTILRQEWGYGGIVVSDWGAIGELIPHTYARDLKEATRKAIVAGVDIDMESHGYIQHLKQLVEEGVVSEQLIDQAVRRVLTLKYALGLFDDPYRYCDEQREQQAVTNPEHRKVARQIAERSIVLLKNQEQLLPLDGRYKKVAIIGPLAKSKADMRGAWSIVRWSEDELVSPYDGISAILPKGVELLYAKGCAVEGSDRSGFAEALKVAQAADVVIFAIGESWTMTGEAKSRSDISIPGVAEELVEAVKLLGKPVVTMVMSGRPMVIDKALDNSDALLYTWWLGSEAGNAMASVLYGRYNPSAKLPMTFPRSVGQIPIYYNMKTTGRPISTEGSIWYRSAYTDLPNSPKFAFGYGLSYTQFDFSDFAVDRTAIQSDEVLKVSCKVKNSGKFDGEEVVQLYISDKFGSVTRPIKELKGLRKIMLKRGESAVVSFEVSRDMLAFWTKDMRFEAEPGEFEVMIGNSSDNILYTQLFTLE